MLFRSALVVAGLGVPVAKHGNRSATSQCGSIDLLEALGVNIELRPEQIANCLDTVGIGILFARMVHPAMKHAAGIVTRFSGPPPARLHSATSPPIARMNARAMQTGSWPCCQRLPGMHRGTLRGRRAAPRGP